MAYISFLALAGAALLVFVAFLFRLDRRRRLLPDAPPLRLPDVGAFVMTPVEAGMAAVERMTPGEREAFRSWLDGGWPRPPGEEGITR